MKNLPRSNNRPIVFPIDYRESSLLIAGVLILLIVSIVAIVASTNTDRADWNKTQSYSFDLQVNMDTVQSGDETEVKRVEGITSMDKNKLKMELDALFENAVRNDVVLDSKGMVTMKLRHINQERPDGKLKFLLTSDDLEDLKTVTVSYRTYVSFQYKSTYTVSEFVVV